MRKSLRNLISFEGERRDCVTHSTRIRDWVVAGVLEGLYCEIQNLKRLVRDACDFYSYRNRAQNHL